MKPIKHVVFPLFLLTFSVSALTLCVLAMFGLHFGLFGAPEEPVSQALTPAEREVASSPCNLSAVIPKTGPKVKRKAPCGGIFPLAKTIAINVDVPILGKNAGSLSIVEDAHSNLKGIYGNSSLAGPSPYCTNEINALKTVTLVGDDRIGDLMTIRAPQRIDMVRAGGPIDMSFKSKEGWKRVRFQVARGPNNKWDIFLCRGGECRESVNLVFMKVKAPGLNILNACDGKRKFPAFVENILINGRPL